MRHDHDIQKAVLEQLDFEPAINSSHIGVAVREGVVTLTGRVPSVVDRDLAIRAAGYVKGVKAVIEQLDVELPGQCETADEIVAQRAYERLASNRDVPLDRLRLAVGNGVVTIRGDVDWHYQRQAAVDDLRRLDCVRDVRDETVIKPPVEAAQVEQRIGDALARLGFGNAGGITVAAEGSKVTLGGLATSWREKHLAETVAWSAPGVSHVENRITVA